MKLNININGKNKTFDIHPKDMLLDVLRREGYMGTKRGCNTGDCGACAVIIDGKAMNSCQVFAASVDGKEIVTIEGIKDDDDEDKPHPITEALIEEGAVQCGYCTPGVTVSAKCLLDNNPKPTREDILEALDGNLCRCTGYVKIIKAVEKASEKMGGNK